VDRTVSFGAGLRRAGSDSTYGELVDRTGDRDSITVRLLGPLEVRVGDRPAALGGQRPRALISLLALSVGTAVSTGRLVEAIWDGDPPPAAANTVQVYVSRLRRALTGPDGTSRLQSSATGYVLELPQDAVDVSRFERLVAQGHARLQSGDAAAASRMLQEALDLWRGPAVPDLAGLRVAEGLIARLDARRLAAHVDRIDADAALGRHAAIVPELQELIRLHPLDEGLVVRLMAALYRCGRQADALAAYTDAATRLADELGVDPSPQLARIQGEVLRHEVAPAPGPPAVRPAPSDPPTRLDPGHPDSGHPDSGHPDSGRPESGGVPGLSGVPAEGLPRPRHGLVGRSRELADALELLADPQVRLVTLLGPGGTGKTRLALEIAERLAAVPSPGGVVVVPLSGVDEPSELLAEVCRALDAAPGWSGEPLLDVAVRALGDGPVVLVLDNLEQLVGGREALDAVGALLDRLPGLTILCTSRTVLRLRGERLLPLDPLPLPEPGGDADLETLRRNDAVRLFCDRAGEVLPDFTLTAGNAPAVAQLCRLLDGLPLALELAAARVRLLAPEQMVGRMARRLQLLSGGARDLPERQRSMRAALDWSAQLLDPAEARLFARLSVFAGGWTVEAAEAVCDLADVGDGGEDVLDVLGRLVDKSLVAAPGSGRLSMLETIRDYATERLSSTLDAGPVRDRHAHYYADLAEELGPRTRTSPDVATRGRLDAEAANFTAALEHANAAGDGVLLTRLVLGLLDYWFFSGRLGQADRWIRAAQGTRMPRHVEARLLLSIGSFAFIQGDLARAAPAFAGALEAARDLDDNLLVARSLAASSAVARFGGRLEAALGHLDEAIAVSRAGRLDALLPQLENERGEVLDGLGRGPQAHRLFEAYRAHALAEGDRSNLAWANVNLALQAVEAGQAQLARQLTGSAVRAADDGGSAPVRADVRTAAGLVELCLGDPEPALALLLDALELTVSAGQLLTMADLVSLIGAVLLALDQDAGRRRPVPDPLPASAPPAASAASAASARLLAAAQLLAAGAAWRRARGLAVVGRLTARVISEAEAAVAGLLSPDELAREQERGLTVPYGRVAALDLPGRAGIDLRGAERGLPAP
jgi:predicted ATPase/DNA-binding SARP family transcriptional activator